MRQMPTGALWLVFTRGGVFSNHPPARPDPDWVAHADGGHQVGTYQHTDDELTIRWPNGTETTAAFARTQTAVTVDGQVCGRCDWALAGHHFRGTWEGRDADARWTFHKDGRFATSDGEGKYELATGAVRLTWADGRSQELSIYSTLQPDSGSPDMLWIGGHPCDRIG
jgi:hypothetical protein